MNRRPSGWWVRAGGIRSGGFLLALVLLPTILLPAPAVLADGRPDYTHFSSLPDATKAKMVWDLFDRKAFGTPDQKPICRDLLATRGRYCGGNNIAFLTAAIDLAEQEGWTDLAPDIQAIYQRPGNIWVYERSFRYLRARRGKPVPEGIHAAAETLRQAGYYQSPVTDAALAAAVQRLKRSSDREAVLVYTLYAAVPLPGKGGADRGKRAAVSVLRSLPSRLVRSRLISLQQGFAANHATFTDQLASLTAAVASRAGVGSGCGR